MPKLNVNIDHVATVRQARGTNEPDPVLAAYLAELVGAHGIVVHLREDRRHIKDASKEFKNKFIIYSPTITTGIDFTTDEPQNVFLYIKGSSITPEASFQQLSRTRNIKNVFFYINETSL